ncbi:DNA-processing protein DprA [Streptomyces sp. 21So2-11]|uniref:DNA-processing protein DprA n=1 Tax=Streptomyces sp. 21So2-11 TaxID=3144408 RepID=UPI0032195912
MSAAVGEAERLARAALTRVIEPGDEVGGRWLREFGAVELMRRLTSDGPEAMGRAVDRGPGPTDGRVVGHAAAGGADGTGSGRAERETERETGSGIEGARAVAGAALTGVSEHRLGGFRARAAAAEPARDLAAVAAVGGRFVCPDDQEWPRQLDDLGDARPIGLWVRGRPQLRIWALRSVAVVGARACTPYGAHMAASLATGLAERGWVVVSGAAFGVDGAAHRGVLAAGGATVAVLACGVDVVYPRGHAELIGRIAEQGLVIGELPPGSHPTPSRFILRNRVIEPSLGVPADAVLVKLTLVQLNAGVEEPSHCNRCGAIPGSGDSDVVPERGGGPAEGGATESEPDWRLVSVAGVGSRLA